MIFTFRSPTCLRFGRQSDILTLLWSISKSITKALFCFQLIALWQSENFSPYSLISALSQILLAVGKAQVHSHSVAGSRPLPGPETCLLSNTRKWIIWEDTCVDKARGFIGKGCPGREQEGKGTQENCSVTWLAVWDFMVMGLVSRLFLASHSDSESFLVVHALFSQDGCQWRILGGGRTCGVSFWPFLNSSSWWWLISSVFLTRTSCHKTTHANGYYGAWPGWAVSVSVLPLIGRSRQVDLLGPPGWSWASPRSPVWLMLGRIKGCNLNSLPVCPSRMGIDTMM